MSVPTCGNGRACGGASNEAEVNPRARRSPLEGAVNPQARRSPLEGAVNPRAKRNLLEGGANPRARRNLLEGAFEWAALVGHGDPRSVGRAPCVCLSEMCLALVFLQVLSRISPVVLGDPQGCPRHSASKSPDCVVAHRSNRCSSPVRPVPTSQTGLELLHLRLRFFRLGFVDQPRNLVVFL
jgi:hypothetical protein